MTNEELRRRESCRLNGQCPWCPMPYDSTCGWCYKSKGARRIELSKPSAVVWRIFELLAMAVVVCTLLAAPVFFLWVYAEWGATCIEHGGQIEGEAVWSHCEGSR